jgi:NADPH:quinone reductase-like Zn-dependent oxidoreductase
MKAVLCGKYGSPDVLRLEEVEKPTPKENEVLIRVCAASVNPLDWHRMRGSPFLVRLGEGLSRPENRRLGADLAGRVEAVGGNVKEFRPGDEVFGVCTGSFGEYVCTAQIQELAPKPANTTFEAAAAVPVGAITALQGLRDAGKIHAGQKVLINGASGGVGTFAVQIAKSFETEVTGVCSTRNLEMVRSIGADHVIDYTREDFTRNGQSYDLIYDAVANHSLADLRRALSPRGTCVVTGFNGMSRLFEHMILGPLTSRVGHKRVGMQSVATPNRKDLVFVKELIEAGKIVPVIDRRYSLSETGEAIRYLETGHARGKVVVVVVNDHRT